MTTSVHDEKEVETRRKVEFLSDSANYPSPLSDITVEETHMSWVFLRQAEVYKLKKPVKTPYLDFSTPKRRETNCREEIRLNRRLAPDVYLGLAALVEDEKGCFSLQTFDSRRKFDSRDDAQIVDWLVRMKRLPENLTLASVCKDGKPDERAIRHVIEKLIGFYKSLAPRKISPLSFVDHFHMEHRSNLDMLERHKDQVEGSQVEALAEWMDRFLNEKSTLLRQRVEQGLVVEGHGDLRPEHIFLTDPPAIIDCLEFNRRLRSVDILDDLTYLHLECRVLEAAETGRSIRKKVMKGLGLNANRQLTAFYSIYRACLRARQALAHLEDPQPKKSGNWPAKARKYLEEAQVISHRFAG